MTHHANGRAWTSSAEAGQQVTQLRHVLQLVEQIAGTGTASDEDAALDENARISGAYEAAPAIRRRRFDALASESGIWAATAVQALVAARDSAEPPRAAARALAAELAVTLKRLAATLES